MHLISVYLEHRTLKLNQTFTYLAPESCLKGMRVRVPFGGRDCVGFVVMTQTYDPAAAFPYELKEVREVLDFEPLLNAELLELGQWMAEETLAPVVSCFQAMLPKLKAIRSSVKETRTERWVSLVSEPVRMTERQALVVDALRQGPMRYTELRKAYGSPLDTLIKNGHVQTEVREISYQIQVREQDRNRPILSEAQQNALGEIRSAGSKPVCLFGATGSGKTELYLTLAEEALDEGRQALILVPEIGLTPQMVERVSNRFGQDVIVYHSHLNDTERFLQYKRVREGERTVVVGTRSAIFLPFTDLALIVLDEEHDGSYKQESHPRYHTRDIALKRALTHQAKLILGSATPSFETYARALKDVYKLVKLQERARGQLPDLTFIKPDKGQKTLLAQETADKIQAAVGQGHQVILLLNRRGYAPLIQCVECGNSLVCRDCDRLLSMHKDENRLKCHSCGLTYPIPETCPTCGSRQLRMIGSGTQKLEEELKIRFPGMRILRMDSDTANRKHGHEEVLASFRRHEADLLLGTQMIAKGLDIPNVTLSVILDADVALMRTDYRSVEDAFDLIVQSAGRSGRGDHPGNVLVQTRLETHYALVCARTHDYERFFNLEMRYRKAGQNPPYTYLIAVTVLAEDAFEAEGVARQLADALSSPRFKVLGPSDLGKLQSRERFRLILKGKDLNEMRKRLKPALDQVNRNPKAEIIADVNPRGLF